MVTPPKKPERREWYYTLLVEAGKKRHLLQALGEGAPCLCEYSNYDVYAALSALGCPLLAVLLTDFEPLDPLSEVVDSWKERLVRVERVYVNGRAVRRERFTGFLVPTHYLERLSRGELEELERRELEGDEGAAARLAIAREVERLIGQAEAGFPNAPEIFDRFVDVIGLLGESINVGMLELSYPEEKLKE